MRLFDDIPIPNPNQDDAIGQVEKWLTDYCMSKRQSLKDFFGEIIRQAIDEVVDGPRTGRWSIVQLEKTEKTYIGTKMEIVTRSALGLEPSKPLDFTIEGHNVDVKWSISSSWTIPNEAVNQICLLIGIDRKEQRFRVGLIRCTERSLNKGVNRDGKRTLSGAGRNTIRWLINDAKLKPNFIAALDPEKRRMIFAEPSGQRRVRAFVRIVARQPFPRYAIETVATNKKDPLRRTRVDRGDRLGGMRVLSVRSNRRLLERLGYRDLNNDDFVSIPADEVPSVMRKG